MKEILKEEGHQGKKPPKDSLKARKFKTRIAAKCPVCDRLFSQRDNMKRHLGTKHHYNPDLTPIDAALKEKYDAYNRRLPRLRAVDEGKTKDVKPAATKGVRPKPSAAEGMPPERRGLQQTPKAMPSEPSIDDVGPSNGASLDEVAEQFESIDCPSPPPKDLSKYILKDVVGYESDAGEVPSSPRRSPRCIASETEEVAKLLSAKRKVTKEGQFSVGSASRRDRRSLR